MASRHSKIGHYVSELVPPSHIFASSNIKRRVFITHVIHKIQSHVNFAKVYLSPCYSDVNFICMKDLPREALALHHSYYWKLSNINHYVTFFRNIPTFTII